MKEGDGGAEMPSISVFSTDDMPAASGYEAWRNLMAASHEVNADPATFRGRVRSVKLGPMLLHEMDAGPQAVSRSRKRIRSDGLEHIVLHVNNVPMRGEAQDQDVAIPAGVVTVNTLGRPLLRSAVPDVGSLLVSLSRDLVVGTFPDPEALHGVALSNGAGSLLRAHMRSMIESAHLVTAESVPALAQATVLLFAAAAKPTRRTVGDARVPIENAALFRARRMIRANLQARDLRPQRIAAASGVSLRTLFRLFAPLGGVAGYVRSERLAAARADLTDMGSRPRIADVAFRYGFRDAAEFSRAFRTAFGQAPSEFFENPRSDTFEQASVGLDFRSWIEALG